MSQPAKYPAYFRFQFNAFDIALREELRLTERQRFFVRPFFESERNHAYIDVLPTTIFVPSDVAESKLAIKRSVIISGVDSEHLHVYGAPDFRSYEPVKSDVIPASFFKPFVNISKDDLKVITVFKTAPPMPEDAALRTCIVCRAPHTDKDKEKRIFALLCGHWACRACWLINCNYYLQRGMVPIPCAHGDCSEKLTIGRATLLLSDEALDMIIAYEWRDKLRMKDTLRCADCRHWMQRGNFYSRARSAICACGCFTCLGCGQADHTPLQCNDAAEWSRIRSIENEDEVAAKAEKLFGLSRENFDDCLSPSQDIASERFKKNLRFMRTNDRKHGKMLEKSMPMVARMLELRLVQQFANRKEMQTRPNDVYGEEINQRWSTLEKYFTLALDTLEETRDKATYLNDSRRHVYSYYELENF